MAIRSEEKIQLSENPPREIVTVKVLLMGELKRWAGRREVEVELPVGSTIRSLGEKLSPLRRSLFQACADQSRSLSTPCGGVYRRSAHRRTG